MKPNTMEQFWAKVTKYGDDGCWIWEAGLREGYGRFKMHGRMYNAHRLSFVWANGEIPDGMVIDHICRNRACVNPIHLRIVTDRQNILAGNGLAAKESAQTHCKRGHPFNDDNTYIRKDGNRRCRACNRAYPPQRAP